MKNIKILTSGTGIERASKALINEKVADVVSVSYTEMLLSKAGQTKYFDDEYLDELDPVKNKRLIEFLEKNFRNKESWKKTLQYAPGINFFKLVLPPKHQQQIYQNIEDDDLTAWSKILSDVDKNSGVIKPIIQGLFGKSSLKNQILDTLSISNAIGREAKVVQVFSSSPTNAQLTKLGNLFQSSLDGYIIRVLSGSESATNKTSEGLVKSDIERCKLEGKEGVVVISKEMGSRSFSVSETDAVVLMFDNGSVGSMIQKISRALTGGKTYYGEDKTEGNVISLSLDPNRIDAVDIYIVEESQKNKTQSESFNSVVRRIRRSVNIFSIDNNGDRVDLLQKDDFYSELIEKFSFERLKNSNIDITPLITDIDLRNQLLDIRSSALAKKEKKVKQLKGKGKKFLDDDGNSTEEKVSEEVEKDLEKVDFEVLRQAVLTINNSLLSIVGIDNSVLDKSKSFRSVLKSIDTNVEKTKEFYQLYNIRPGVVITLLDRRVINEDLVDICLSRF